MNRLAKEIEQLYNNGYSPADISSALKCPKVVVLEWMSTQSARPFEEWSAEAQVRLLNAVRGK